MVLLYGLFTFFVYFLLPNEVYAWGPGAHLSYALHALSHVAVLAPPIRALLKKYPDVFLYGSIAADIIVGKKYAGDLYHCHHWEVALPLLDRAKSDRQKAFVYGYLAHLSVDTVAHNYFVPFHIIRSYQTLTLRHTYWEMRYDLKMDPIVWNTLQEIAKGDYLEMDDFLENSLKKALFSFKTNKKIFNSLLIVQRTHRWRKAASLLTKRSAHRLTDKDVKEYKGICYEVVVEFLKGPEKARVLNADPSGKLKLLYAKDMVKDLRKYRRKRISRYQAGRFIQTIKSRLKEGLYKPVDLPMITDAIR